jgi:hypothetical protein
MKLQIINNYFPATHPNRINEVILYKQNGTIPDYLSPAESTKFQTRFDPFEVRNGHLFYQDLEVIPRDQINQKLEQIYADNTTHFNGIVAFYKYVSSKYLNIKRIDVQNFLQDQSNYQLTRPQKHVTRKPILAYYVNEIWCIDLIDMQSYVGHNSNYKYIFTCVDVFSRRVWLRPLKNKTQESIVQVIQDILQEASHDPRIILCDNGTEFKNKLLKTFLKQQGILIYHTATYSPQSNAIVERKNKEVRKILRQYATDNNTLRWIDFLSDAEKYLNNQYSAPIKEIPQELYDTIDDAKKNKTVIANEKRIRKTLTKFRVSEMEVDQLVRIHLSALYSKFRKIVKEKKGKLLPVVYTPEIYTIVKKIIPRRGGIVERFRYQVAPILPDGTIGEIVTKKTGRKKEFYAVDLQKTDKKVKSDLTIVDVFRLDKFRPIKGEHVYPYPNVEEAYERAPAEVIPNRRVLRRDVAFENPDYFNEENMNNPNYGQRDPLEWENPNYFVDGNGLNLWTSYLA